MAKGSLQNFAPQFHSLSYHRSHPQLQGHLELGMAPMLRIFLTHFQPDSLYLITTRFRSRRRLTIYVQGKISLILDNSRLTRKCVSEVVGLLSRFHLTKMTPNGQSPMTGTGALSLDPVDRPERLRSSSTKKFRQRHPEGIPLRPAGARLISSSFDRVRQNRPGCRHRAGETLPLR